MRVDVDLRYNTIDAAAEVVVKNGRKEMVIASGSLEDMSKISAFLNHAFLDIQIDTLEKAHKRTMKLIEEVMKES